MTTDKYIQMCEEFGDPIDEDAIPPSYEDFPSYVHYGILIFNALPDIYTSTMETVLFTGKDYSSLPILFELYRISQDDRLLIFEIIQFLDSRARKQALDRAKKPKKPA